MGAHTESFHEFLTEKRFKIRVLILGDYSKNPKIDGPIDLCEAKLRLIQSYLKENGFEEVYLVKDFLNEFVVPDVALDEHFIKKSQYYIKNWAEILIFVLLKEGDHQSVIREWAFLVLECPEKANNSIMLCHQDVKLRALIRGDLKSFRVTYEIFDNDENMCIRAYNQVFIKLYGLA